MYENKENTGAALSWDSEVNQESTGGYTVIKEGDYRFRMTALERGRHGGSAKLPACPKAICTIQIVDKDGDVLTEIKHQLFLHSLTEGMLSAFFIATGAKKHGEPLNISKGFTDSIGRVGWCHVYVDKWTGDDGKERESNKIKYFIDPGKAPAPKPEEAAPTPQPKSWNHSDMPW